MKKTSTDILLLYPPWDVKFYQAPGLPQLAGYLLENGIAAEILDSVVRSYDFQQVLEHIEKINPLVVGVSIPFTPMVTNGIKMLRLCREKFPEKLLLCGGYHAAIKPGELAEHCDLVVLGEGEITTAEIIKKYGNGKNIFDVSGTACKKNGELQFNKVREPVKDIDALPFPAWQLVPLEGHKLTLYLTTGERAFPLQTGRGCPFSCTFCCNSKRYEKVRYRDMECVIEEVKYIIKNFGVRGFHIWDETFTLKRERVVDFCTRIMRGKIKIRWSCQTRANLIDTDLLALMKKAGCVRMSIGVESGDKWIIERINKKIVLEDVERAIALINSAGIVSYAGFMIGHPDDTPETVSRTIAFADRTNPHFVGFRNAIPYPGCVFREIAEREGGILTSDWSKYDDRQIVYVPPGMKGYDLAEARRMAYSYFYWQNTERIKRILDRGFVDLFKDTLMYGPAVYIRRSRGEKVTPSEMLDRYCRTDSKQYKSKKMELADVEV
jgi:radical SAM superfamily enzyme YgiQ (UPF0313 family)